MSLPLAVADTSVLISLHHLELLTPLSLLYAQILVPSPVRLEFLRRNDQQSREFALITLTQKGLFSPCDDYDSIEVDLYKSYKMEGAEAEALSQTKMRKADVLLIDEKIGRKIAVKERRPVKGTASILAEFHRLDVANFHRSIARLRSETTFRIHQDIVDHLAKDL
ncbi:MAG: hypothetical protein ACKVRP_03350 [Bacteroidota bacterium]